jgi:Uma2 family endonuclease
MSMLAQSRMTVDEFLVWAEGQEGRWELYNGVAYRMAPERTRHVEVKFAVQVALRQAIRKAGAACHMLADGAGVRISRYVMHIPDALVYCGPKLPGDAMEVPNPVIVVEVASPSTRNTDDTVKLTGYFSLPSVVHRSRQPDGIILRSLVHHGTLTLSPLGIELNVAELFAEA